MRPVVCLITDRARLDGDEAALVRRVRVCAQAGVHLVQVRERDMADAALVGLVARVVGAVRGTRTRVLVNDRADIALVAGAHGVHLRADSAPAARVRAVAPPGFLLGRSVHDAEDAQRMAAEGAVDYLLFGTVFATVSKPGRPAAGVDALRAAVGRAPAVPLLAVGGVTLETLPRLKDSGCAGFAAIGLFADVPEPALAGVVAEAVRPWENQT